MRASEHEKVNVLALFLRILLIVSGIEFLVMIILDSTGLRETAWEGAVDALLLAALSTPVLSVGVVRSMSRVARKAESQAREIHEMTEELEERRRAEAAVRANERILSLIYNGVSDLIFLVEVEPGPRFRCVTVNQSYFRVTGLEHDQVVGRYVEEVLPPAAADFVIAKYLEAMATGRTLHYEESVDMPAGRVVVETSLTPVFDADGRCTHLLGVARDITHRKRMEESLRKAQEIARLGSWDWDVVTGRLHWSDEVYRIFGIEPDAFGASYEAFLRCVHPEDRPSVEEAVEAALEGRRPYSIDHRVIRPDGSERIVHEEAEVVRDQSGKPIRMIGTVQDITERKRYEAEIERMANQDALTGLYNRRRFEEELSRLIAESRERGEKFAVFFLDLDNFKYINDTLGHRAGDLLLQSVAERIGQRLRHTDVVARLGGDEFAALLPRTDVAGARAAAEHILEAARHEVVLLEDQPVSVSVSIGIAVFPDHGETAEELLARADMAMYRAKEEGRNCAWVYSDQAGQQAQMHRALVWEKRIRRALEEDGFELFLQPIMDLASGRISQYEALLRLADEGGSYVLPGAFLDVAERFGLMRDIDRWVVRRAVRLAAELERAGIDAGLEVNLSARALADSEILDLIRRELAAAGVAPARLIFEITETAAAAGIGRAQQFILSLKALGCRFALDDFGVGFSSFSHLKLLPVDYLKIDGSFIRQLPRDVVDQHLVRAMVEVAHGLGKRTVAEFVGDAETVAVLRKLGVDYAQGWHVGKPRPVREILGRNDPIASADRLR